MADVFSTMKAYTGSVYVNDFNLFNRIYRVYIQAEAPYRAHRDNIGLFFVKGSDGNMIPLTSLGTTDYTTGPGSIKRFNSSTPLSSTEQRPTEPAPDRPWKYWNRLHVRNCQRISE